MYACQILYPFVVNENNTKTIKLLIDDLVCISDGFLDVYCNINFIQKLKYDVPFIKELTDSQFDWDGVESKRAIKSNNQKGTTIKKNESKTIHESR